MDVRHALRSRTDAGQEVNRPRPRTGSWAAGAAGVVAVVAGLVWAITGVLDLVERIDGYPQVPAGAQHSVEIREAGDRVVYYEGPAAGGATASAPDLDDLPVEVTDPSGATVSLEPYETDLRYRLFDRAGEAVASFPADTSGTYDVALAGDAPTGAVVAVGEGVPAAAIGRITAAAVLVLVGLGVAGVAGVAARRR